MKAKTLATALISASVIFASCGGGGGGDTASTTDNNYTYTQPDNPPAPVKTTSTINGKINNLSAITTQSTNNLYIVAVYLNDLKMPVRELEPINEDGTFTIEVDKNKPYALFIQNDKNEYLAGVKTGNELAVLTFDADETNLELDYNSGDLTIFDTNADISTNIDYSKDTDNDGIPFVADFTEVNEKFNYKVYFDDSSESSMSLEYGVLNQYKWAYMHYVSSFFSATYLSELNKNSDKFSFPTFCVDVERDWQATKQDRKINGKIFRRIEGLLPIYVRDNISQKTREKLKEAINKWNEVFTEIGINNKIKLYYAGEVIENNYFYNAINNDWRGIYVTTISNTTSSNIVVENSFWNDIDDSFELSEVDNAIEFTSLYPFDEWKPRIDEIMNVYPDGVFYIEYKYDENGNPIDYGAVISQIGKPMQAVILNSYYENTYDYKSNIIHEIGHILGLFHPFEFETKFPNYPYIPDLKGKESVMNYYNSEGYPDSYYPSELDKEVLRYIYNFQTGEEITIDNVSEFLRQKCGF